MVLKANDRRTSSLCHDEFRGPRSDCVRQVLNIWTDDLLDYVDEISGINTKAITCCSTCLSNNRLKSFTVGLLADAIS
ncbi:hypothetical protein TNCV_1214831 [Trichonephila clavipes]|nr:hypothetical protein TNCV_1214831 [Trichonephila clavipes]